MALALLDFKFIAKSTPAILVLGGFLLIFFNIDKALGIILIILGALVSLAWAGVFKRF